MVKWSEEEIVENIFQKYKEKNHRWHLALYGEEGTLP